MRWDHDTGAGRRADVLPSRGCSGRLSQLVREVEPEAGDGLKQDGNRRVSVFLSFASSIFTVFGVRLVALVHSFSSASGCGYHVLFSFAAMAFSLQSFLVTLFAASTFALPYIPEYEAYNLNQNKTATSPLEYWGEWPDHRFHPSPENWRMPFYSLFLDRFVNGDPSNDNSNGTAFEVDMLSTQLRVGGDIAGLVDTLDYLQGMGIKVMPSASFIQISSATLTSGRHFTSPEAPSSTSPGQQILLVLWT